jgi:hypothetical protein
MQTVRLDCSEDAEACRTVDLVPPWKNDMVSLLEAQGIWAQACLRLEAPQYKQPTTVGGQLGVLLHVGRLYVLIWTFGVEILGSCWLLAVPSLGWNGMNALG